ncbi:putative G-protein coupled receptor 139 [Tubulanus polymorphus]|uniref:putative G-protein coupled receptor 139 n=1 Tax=Tubulanus polymorphus TaxID=672921 RepID=UPI003DA3C54E
MAVTYSSDIACALHEYIAMVNDAASSWMVIIITAERFAIVVWPFAARTIATPSFSRKVIVIFTVFFACYFCYLFKVIAYNVEMDACVMTQFGGDMHFQSATVTVVYLPTVLVIALNILLALILRRSNKFGDGGSKAASTRKATVMVMTVSILFLIFTYPTASVLLVSTYVPIKRSILNILSAVTGAAYAMNSAINFYVYLLAGDEVRNFVKEKLMQWFK